MHARVLLFHSNLFELVLMLWHCSLQRYTTSMTFLNNFEQTCGSIASVRRLRAHPSYNTFLSKWSLPVYFQIRFQEIAGSLEAELGTEPIELASSRIIFTTTETGL